MKTGTHTQVPVPMTIPQIEEGSPTGMKASERKGSNEVKRYDLSGRAAKNSSRGVNIIHMDDGTTKKILVK